MPVYSIFFNISVQFSRSVVFDSATPWTAACQASLSITSSWSLVKSLSRVRLFVTPWTAAHQAPQSMGFSKQEYWSGLPFPSPGDLPNPGIEPGSPALEANTLTSEPPGKPQSSGFPLVVILISGNICRKLLVITS